MVYLSFVLELFLLFLFSRVLSRSLSRFLYRITKNEKLTIYLVAILFFPGVAVHETAHWLMAQLLFVPTGSVEFLPVLRGSELKLGSVKVAQTDPIRRALIGVAPFLFGTALLLLLLFFSSQLTAIPERFRGVLIGYILFEIGNTMFSSRKDLEGTIELLLTALVISGILYFLGVRIPDAFIVFFNSNQVISFFSDSSFYLLFPLGIDIFVITFLFIWAKLTT